MTAFEINPFQELYVTDSADPRVYVNLFSEKPVANAHALFRPGNVILKGTEGSGKSMLLNLLRPEIRLAYFRAGDLDFPVPASLSNFLGAGINLTRSGILDIGQRPIHKSLEEDEFLFPLYFADFLNYHIVGDLLNNLQIMASNPDCFQDIVDNGRLAHFAETLSAQQCWFGYLANCKTYDDLTRRIADRLMHYRLFHNSNAELPEAISQTKTTIGEPIARTADCLRETGLIGSEIPVYVRVDQLERLRQGDIIRDSLGRLYRMMVNKALGMRESRVSYRIGTRPYGWDQNLQIYGTGDYLEHLRDFRIIDLDHLLRRREDTKTWLFPTFVNDVFVKRLKYALDATIRPHRALLQVFGQGTPIEELARAYSRTSNATRVLKLDQSWPSTWRNYLATLFESDPLEAILAASWVRQNSGSSSPKGAITKPPPISKAEDRPWLRMYWRKERVRQALLQVAARTAQRLQWSGRDSILALSAGNVTVFLSICHEVWDAFLLSQRSLPPDSRQDPLKEPIGHSIQAVAIQTASSFWFNKIKSKTPGGHDRQRFVDVIGRVFRTFLLNDISMSYPGRNGFSLAVNELERAPALAQFLGDAVDYSDLHSAPHTTKHKGREARTKWYLNPILSVVFQIPESHSKEPHYSSLQEVQLWLRRAKIVLPSTELPVEIPRNAGSSRTRRKVIRNNLTNPRAQLSLLPSPPKE